MAGTSGVGLKSGGDWLGDCERGAWPETATSNTATMNAFERDGSIGAAPSERACGIRPAETDGTGILRPIGLRAEAPNTQSPLRMNGRILSRFVHRPSIAQSGRGNDED